MTNGTEKYISTVQYLSKLYDTFNSAFFGGELVKPVITVQQCARNKYNGWWTVKRTWFENKEDSGEYELNISAQFLDRSIVEIAATLLHEMCHQYASANGIQDCSRSGTYHNTQYKRIAESHGLTVQKAPSIGWSVTELGEHAQAIVSGFVQENPETLIYRSQVFKVQKVKSSSTRKYVCPCCGMSVRATKTVNIMCADCNQIMDEE